MEQARRTTAVGLACGPLVAAARQLTCHYPAKGDTCDDHRRRGTPDFTPCQPCVVRRVAETFR